MTTRADQYIYIDYTLAPTTRRRRRRRRAARVEEKSDLVVDSAVVADFARLDDAEERLAGVVEQDAFRRRVSRR